MTEKRSPVIRHVRLYRPSMVIVLVLTFYSSNLLAQGTILNNKRLIEQEHRYAEALANLQKAVAKDRNSAPLHYWLSIAYYKNERFAEAAEAMEKALSLKLYKTYLSSAYEYLGTSYNRIGKYDRALEIFDKAIAINSGHQEARNGRDIALQNLRKTEAEREGTAAGPSPINAAAAPAKPPAASTTESRDAVIMIGAISVYPKTVAAGEFFEVTIDLFAESPARERKNLSVVLLYSVARDGQVLQRFEPETLEAMNGESTILQKKMRASKTPGDYDLTFELRFENQKAEGSIVLKVR